ncbi:uncharacterized skeletal organic matrix protein 7 [Nematostella vectensis]|uniref:uncharacterized skeletal organic matrix protein 7 n=1 Tax=Nematostella vectensis TaxID=45351 RepID=UPI0013901093|nr:uncharacterized skeletal organic matrix protein 7 [Nematostella vectensis]
MRLWRVDGSNYLYPSVMFNVIDDDNFDMVYLRSNDPDRCVQPAYVWGGGNARKDFSASDCLAGTPPNGEWFSVTLNVTQSSVTLTMNGVFAKTFKPHFPLKRRIGFGVPADFNNHLQFKNVKLY